MWDRRTAEGEEGGHAAQRVAAVPRGDLEGLVDVVDREGHAVYADLVRARGSVSIVSGWMYSKTSRRPLPSGVWRLASGAWRSWRGCRRGRRLCRATLH